MAQARIALAAIVAATVAVPWQASAGETLDFSPAERAAILAHGPWPPPPARDPGNRASGNPTATELGRRLFFDVRLSHDKGGSCATCHQPDKYFTDGLATAVGTEPLHRNTPSLLNVRLQRWFGWDGAGDSLWAQSLRPILAPDEMSSTALDTANLLAGDTDYSELFRRAYGLSFDTLDAEQTFVLAGKALAAYQETLISGRTAFDEFRDALAGGNSGVANEYPPAAQRGLRLFVGEGRCNLCHFGANFTNGEFGDVGVPYFTAAGVDAGRYKGIQKLRANRYNLLGPFNDDLSGNNAQSTRHVHLQHRNWGEFRVPSLRSVAATAPYMHDGSLATLRDVIVHYSQLDEERLHTDGEKILRPLNLSDAQIDDLIAFLQTLTDDDSLGSITRFELAETIESGSEGRIGAGSFSSDRPELKDK